LQCGKAKAGHLIFYFCTTNLAQLDLDLCINRRTSVAQFKQLETFVSVASRGSLSAAAAAEGVAPAIIGRRIDALEERLGVKLLVRTTRKITLTFEGSAFLEDCQRILNDLHNAEASVSAGGVKASGHLRITAPAGFGRKHVAPLVPCSSNRILTSHSRSISPTALSIWSTKASTARSGLATCPIRAWSPSGWRKTAASSSPPPNTWRAPARRTARGTGASQCLAFGASANVQRGWVFQQDGRATTVKVGGNMECTDGAVLHEWCLGGYGLAWRSWWEVGQEIASGRLVTVLDEFQAPPIGIHAVFPQRKHLPLRVRLFIDHLKNTYGNPAYWRRAEMAQPSTNAGVDITAPA
jgi:DNA-binding transcriptional LysR family regulator